MARSFALSVVDALATESGVRPAELRPPLGEFIDLDALESLFRDGTGELGFRYRNDLVTVDGHGEVEVAPPEGN